MGNQHFPAQRRAGERKKEKNYAPEGSRRFCSLHLFSFRFTQRIRPRGYFGRLVRASNSFEVMIGWKKTFAQPEFYGIEIGNKNVVYYTCLIMNRGKNRKGGFILLHCYCCSWNTFQNIRSIIKELCSHQPGFFRAAIHSGIRPWRLLC